MNKFKVYDPKPEKLYHVNKGDINICAKHLNEIVVYISRKGYSITSIYNSVKELEEMPINLISEDAIYLDSLPINTNKQGFKEKQIYELLQGCVFDNVAQAKEILKFADARAINKSIREGSIETNKRTGVSFLLVMPALDIYTEVPLKDKWKDDKDV